MLNPKLLNKQSQTLSLRLGLCGVFHKQPIKFRNTTAKSISRMSRPDALKKLSELCLANAEALMQSLEFCRKNGIGGFRLCSHILPLKAALEYGYEMSELPDSDVIIDCFRNCGNFAAQHDIRTSFYSERRVILNSPKPAVVEQSIAELEYYADVAEWVGADVLGVQAGGGHGGKAAAIKAFGRNLDQLSKRTRRRLAVLNDDGTFTPSDLLPMCEAAGIPLAYDVHHHRCNPDDFSIEEATSQAVATWDREPLFHISSPLEGWKGPRPKRHHDFIDIMDFPECWRERKLTVDVEAKAQELAVLKLKRQLSEQWIVYILRCADGTLYTGITNNPDRRLNQHNAGTASRYTRSRLPVAMLYRENQPSKSSALKRELEIKALSRDAKLKLIKAFADIESELRKP